MFNHLQPIKAQFVACSVNGGVKIPLIGITICVFLAV